MFSCKISHLKISENLTKPPKSTTNHFTPDSIKPRNSTPPPKQHHHKRRRENNNPKNKQHWQQQPHPTTTYMKDFILNHLKQWPLPLLILLAGLIWGLTNPFMSSLSRPTPNNGQNPPSFFEKVIAWVPFAIVFGINQLGSILNIILLGVGDMSAITPFINTIAFVTTVIVELIFFQRQRPSPQYFIGMALVVIGTWIAMP